MAQDFTKVPTKTLSGLCQLLKDETQNTINYNLRYNLRYNIPVSAAQQLIDNAIEQRREIIGYYIASQNN